MAVMASARVYENILMLLCEAEGGVGGGGGEEEEEMSVTCTYK